MNSSHSPEVASLSMNGGVSRDSGNDPQSIFQTSDRLWQRLVQEYPDVLTDVEERQEIRKKLRDKEIIMCVLGRHNCGKSTLLNALLVNRCLPTAILNETGVSVKIIHDPSVHPGYCTDPCQQRKCPWLSDGITTTQGADSIWDVLKEANAHHRQTGVQAKKQYTLYAHVPILENVPAGWHFVLEDTPGFGEANMESIKSLATKRLQISSTYLYIVDVNSIGDETDAKNMKSIFDRDRKVFLDNRIVIAVTKYDDCRPKSARSRTKKRTGNVPSLQELQQRVSHQVKDITGMECPLEIIVPVSAEWAEQARELRQEPSGDLRQDVTESLSKVPEPVMQGQGETAQSIPSLTLASQLEWSSGILQLEERLRRMIEHCIQSWVIDLATGYAAHLSEVKASLENQQKKEQKDMEDIQCEFQKHDYFQTAKKEFMGKAWRGDGETQIEKDLKAQFDEVDMPEARELVSRVITERMESFATVMKMEVMKKDPPVDEQSLQQSIKKFAKEDLEEKLNTYLQESRLLGVTSVYKEYQHEVEQEDRRIEEAALALLPQTWGPHDDTLKKERKLVLGNVQGKELLQSRTWAPKEPAPENTQERGLLGSWELTVRQLELGEKPTIPPIKISLFRRLIDSIRRFFRLKVEERKYTEWSGELDAMVEEFRTMSITQAQNYIQRDLKEWIVNTLTGIYYTQMKKRAEAICRTFDPDVGTRRGELQTKVEVTRARIQKVSRDIAEVSKNLKSLEELHTRDE